MNAAIQIEGVLCDGERPDSLAELGRGTEKGEHLNGRRDERTTTHRYAGRRTRIQWIYLREMFTFDGIWKTYL